MTAIAQTANPTQNRAETFRDEITAKLIELLEQVDPKDWKLPWHRAGTIFGINNPLCPLNATTRNRYNGINWLVLALASGLDATGPKYTSARFATYLQWQQAGFQVRAGSHGLPIVKVGTFNRKDKPTESRLSGEDESKAGKYLKVYTVFSAEQVEGTDAPMPAPVLSEADRLAGVEAFACATKADIRVGGDRACCSTNKITGESFISMPAFDRFTGVEAYYGTLLHELIHWTGLPTGRSARIGEMFDDLGERYAFEELVAELGSAMLCGELQVSNEPRPDHAAYLASWLQGLRNDKAYIMRAAAQAQQAVQHLMTITGRAPAIEEAG